jgi:Integrase core domain/Mu transposase, C-terminal
MKRFSPSQLFRLKALDILYRVVWINPSDRSFYAIGVDATSGMPQYFSTMSIDAWFEEDDIETNLDDPWSVFRNPVGGVSERHIKVRDKAWELVSPLVFAQPEIFDDRWRGQAIKRRAIETGQPKNFIYRSLRRYWQRGMTPNCLLPDYSNCGGFSIEKAAGDKPRGRPRKTDALGMNITPETRKLFTSHITKTFAKNKTMSLKESHTFLLLEYFSESTIDPVTGRQSIEILAMHPTFAQFKYWFEKENDIFDVKRRRISARIYDKDHRGITGSSTAEAFGPGSRYQIDATIVDVYLISRILRKKIVGRPTLYVVIDVFTRMIVGIYVGLEAPSWVGAMQALQNAGTKKAEYCAKFGVEIEDIDWPSFGLPERILADRGELASDMIETLINVFGIHIENTAPYRADWKGIVEQRFKLIPSKFKAYVPGYIDTDYRARGGTDYRLDATLDIDEFTRIIVMCVLHYNNDHVIKGYEKLPEMVADKVPAIPIELWEWGIQNRSGLQRQVSPDLLRRALLPSVEATITASGIRMFNCFYSCPLAIEEHWFAKARQLGSWKVRVSYDPRKMDIVYLHPERPSDDFIICGMTEKSRNFRGMTLWEISHMQAEDRIANLAADPRKLRGELNLIANINEVVARAIDTKPDTSGLSKTSRVGSIRENRRAEVSDLRRRDAAQINENERKIQNSEVLAFPNSEQSTASRKLTTKDFLASIKDDNGVA